jgi:hypothetical protein
VVERGSASDTTGIHQQKDSILKGCQMDRTRTSDARFLAPFQGAILLSWIPVVSLAEPRSTTG